MHMIPNELKAALLAIPIAHFGVKVFSCYIKYLYTTLQNQQSCYGNKVAKGMGKWFLTPKGLSVSMQNPKGETIDSRWEGNYIRMNRDSSSPGSLNNYSLSNCTLTLCPVNRASMGDTEHEA